MHRTIRLLAILLMVPAALSQKPAAKPPAPKPDVLVFANGDQLTGKLVGAADGNVVFASDMAGTLTISFDKIKELRSGGKPAEFALLRKGFPVKKLTPAPEGTITIAGGKVLVHQGQPANNKYSSSVEAAVPTGDVAYLVGKAEFDHQVGPKHGFTEGWNGTATGAATIVRSTTTGTTLTAALNLARVLPTVSWLPPRNRTTVNIVETYGKNTTNYPPPAVSTLSSIFHADSERDEYFTPRFYALGDVAFDHNYAQGLQFQQIYGGGVGWTPVKRDRQQLDLKADLHYEKQQFITTPVNGAVTATVPSTNIVGSTLFEGYRLNLPHKMVFTQTANILPAFNDASAYSANLNAALAMPVFKRLSATVSTTDNYLNDPSPGYNRNSYQFVTGVTYALR